MGSGGCADGRAGDGSRAEDHRPQSGRVRGPRPGAVVARAEKGLYDLGLEIATRSGIIGAYRAENTPEATSALDNIEELLNSMQLFNEQREAEIRAGERQQEERATIEEWLQG